MIGNSLVIGFAGITDAVHLVWNNLGIFRYLFGFCLLVIVVFLVRGWRLLLANSCPFDFRAPDPSRENDLTSVVRDGSTGKSIRDRFFQGRPDSESNLFFRYLSRFGSRDRSRDLAPSLWNSTEEFYQIGQIQNLSGNVRFMSSLLPAIGLLGTLIGMFNAFFGADFAKGTELSLTMQELMRNFSLALFTTLVAVLMKIVVDLFNHFTLEIYIDKIRGDLVHLRSVLLDMAVDGASAAAAEVLPETEPETVAVGDRGRESD